MNKINKAGDTICQLKNGTACLIIRLYVKIFVMAVYI